jgi:hypothetical protein
MIPGLITSWSKTHCYFRTRPMGWMLLLLIDKRHLNKTVIAQFVARSNGYEVEGQTGVTGTYPTQCHHDGEVLSL